ncbi:hypothetical protein RCH09_003188 [Actimicrobium sp. GrIS 1.19]|uniref:hypothetical protein n=1 Tax=Actimicrobium sp. GrIS 1.19 TaxID=3071708 RepID=UPI002E0A71D4|nr:hypothetical protein [Actimicrobium sp. GrIS 1.19]
MTTIERTSILAVDTVSSGISWGAIFGGAAAAASLSLILLILGVGLGFSAMSPWASMGASATAIGVSSIVWLTFTQIAASGVGGYLAGRLRTKWATVHTDEVYFRDTAHGFIAWSVATLATAMLLGSVVGDVVSGGAKAAASGGTAAAGMIVAAGNHQGMSTAATAQSGTAGVTGNDGAIGYTVDTMLRTDPTAAEIPGASDPRLRVEAGRILVQDLRTGVLLPADRQYLSQVVAKNTGIPLGDAEKRVDTAFNNAMAAINKAELAARQAADSARKATVYASIWMFVALLMGAFVASLAATFGGRTRDGVRHVPL